MRRATVGGAVLALVIGPAGVWSMQSLGSAAADDPFTCRGSALRVEADPAGPFAELGGLEEVVANDANNPCVTEEAGVLNEQALGPLGTASVLFARTDATEGSFAEAGVADVTLTVPGAPVIQAEVLTAQASAECDGRTPALNSESTVARLTIDGEAIDPLEGPQSYDIGIGTLHLNQQTFSAEDGATRDNTVTQRALFLDTPLVDVVVGEAIADFRGNPCVTTPPPPPPTATPTATISPSATPTATTSPSSSPTPRPSPTCRTPRPRPTTSPVSPAPRPSSTTSPSPRPSPLPLCPTASPSSSASPTPTVTRTPTPRPTQTPPPPRRAPQCSDEVDNDRQGDVDFGQDPDCASPQDDNEARDVEPQCSDGVNNDGDPFTDYPADPGCDNRADNNESDSPNPECSDNRDNDRDGRNNGDDSGCTGPQDDDEADGFLTGGGGYDEGDGEDTVDPGSSLRYSATLPCDLGGNPGPKLGVTFLDNGNEARFQLSQLTRAFCRNDPNIDPENPASEFDTYVGEGTGTLRVQGRTTQARAEFILVDRGEPGAPAPKGVDFLQVRIVTADGTVYRGCCTLDQGNVQAHSQNESREASGRSGR